MTRLAHSGMPALPDDFLSRLFAARDQLTQFLLTVAIRLRHRPLLVWRARFPRGTAARLLGGTLLLLSFARPAGAASVDHLPGSTTAAAPAAVRPATNPTRSPVSSGLRAAAEAAPRVYVVRAAQDDRPRDTLWRIAERYLGDPWRWRQIYTLNKGRPQPDGRRLTRADLIRPGWVLRLPPDAIGLPAHPPSPLLQSVPTAGELIPVGRPLTAPRYYVVRAARDDRPRDTLWRVAERYLGDPLRWREIHALSKGRPQPDGCRLTRADLIRPGWVLRLPPDAIGLPPNPPTSDPSALITP